MSKCRIKFWKYPHALYFNDDCTFSFNCQLYMLNNFKRGTDFKLKFNQVDWIKLS